MAVFREQEFTYKGEALKVIPSLALLRRIKERGINNVILANRCINGGADIEDLAVAHAEFMRAAGWDREATEDEPGRRITEEESYGFLTSGDLNEIMQFQQTYVQAVLPAVDFGKKPEAPGKSRKPRKKASRKT